MEKLRHRVEALIKRELLKKDLRMGLGPSSGLGNPDGLGKKLNHLGLVFGHLLVQGQ